MNLLFNLKLNLFREIFVKTGGTLLALKEKDVTTIISLTAKYHDFGIGHDESFDTNEEGTRVLCDAASEIQIKKIIFYSSVAVYGIREQISDEQMEPRPDSPYGASKPAGERVLQEWAAEDPTRISCYYWADLGFCSK